VLFIFSFLTWLILTWPVDLQHIIVGLAVAVFIAAVSGGLFIQRVHHFRQPTRYLWFCYYIPVFLWECLKANIDVALRVLNPRLPINPGIVKVRTTLKSDTGLTFLANSITLTPGTFCIDINAKEGILYIHWLNVLTKDTEQATQLIVTKFENILKRIFE
jgi:multicomponent Na+:H+ antiporter subunit E